MTLEDLTGYALAKYGIREERKWEGFPGFSVLCDPVTGRWAALLMRQWDTESGTEIQCCDLKCGQQVLERPHAPYLGRPYRMHGDKWVGVRMDGGTDPGTVLNLFDRAVASGEQRGYTVVLDPVVRTAGPLRQDTPLVFRDRPALPREEEAPAKIRQMRSLYLYGGGSFQEKCRNFYLQGMYMRDYEDSVPWDCDYDRYFPTYHDLNVRQLRAYFSWRTRFRGGDWQPISGSAPYLYLFELLNGIGVSSPGDALEKMRAFESGFLDAGFGSDAMRRNVGRWMAEFAVLKNLPRETAQACADREVLRWDRAMEVLRQPDGQPDEVVFDALSEVIGKKLTASPLFTHSPDRGKHLFSEVWRHTLSAIARNTGKDLFSACFGQRSTFPWYPLANTVYYYQGKPDTLRYVLDDCREYQCMAGAWYVLAYDRLTMDRKLLGGFFHETDIKLRRYLKTGRCPKEKPENAWLIPYIDRVIEKDREEEREAARPKVVLDLSGLDRIRRDASVTRDSLLTGEELPDGEEEAAEAPAPAAEAREPLPDVPLSALQVRVLRALLSGGDAMSLLREDRLMPSVMADGINEALFEEFGDTVLSCDGDRLSLVEDYREDLDRLLGGTNG